MNEPSVEKRKVHVCLYIKTIKRLYRKYRFYKNDPINVIINRVLEDAVSDVWLTAQDIEETNKEVLKNIKKRNKKRALEATKKSKGKIK